MPSRRRKASVVRRARVRGARAGGARLGEAPVHALGRDQHALRGDAEERAELVARVPRGHEHARRSLDRRAHADVQHRAVAQREPLRVPQERDVVDGDHRRCGGAERRGVGGVDDARRRGPCAAATSPTARRETSERRDSTTGSWAPTSTPRPETATSSRRPSSSRPESSPAHVGLVAGLAGAEHVAVDQDRGRSREGCPPPERPVARRSGRPRAGRARAPPPRARRRPPPPRRRGRRLGPRRAPASAPPTPTGARRGRDAGAVRGRRAARRCGWPRAAGRADRRRTPRRPAAAGR